MTPVRSNSVNPSRDLKSSYGPGLGIGRDLVGLLGQVMKVANPKHQEGLGELAIVERSWW